MNPFKLSKESMFSSFMFTYLEPIMQKATKVNSESTNNFLPPLKEPFTGHHIYNAFSRNHYRSRSSLLWAILSSLGVHLYLIAALNLCLLVIYGAEPMLISKLIHLMENTECDEDFNKGLLMCLYISGLVFLRCVVYNVMYLFQYIATAKITSTLSACVFEKSTKLSANEYEKQGHGKIIYLIKKAKKVSEFVPSILAIIANPIKLLITSILYIREVGFGFFLAVIAGGISLSLNVLITSKIKKLSEGRDVYGKQGVKYTVESIKGIKTIKLNNWESVAKNKTATSFKSERQCDTKIALWSQINEGQKEILSQVIVVSAILISFWLEGNLSASKAYIILILYQQLRFPLFSLAGLFSRYAEMKQNIKLLEEFLDSEEKASERIKDENLQPGAMKLENILASCYEVNKLKEERIIFSDLSFKINAGELVGIVGPVGSGKSLLFRCILGEINIERGSVGYGGKIVYLSQEPWIFTDTLRNNIIMTSEYNPKKYNSIIDLCQLQADIDILEDKDRTIIGSRGVNLSGGQRQRVALARALYNPGDIYIFDDSLSQLDPEIAEKIFSDGLNNYLKEKTRLIVTGNAKNLINFERVLLIENGSVTAEGSYKELLSVKAFSSLIKENNNKKPVAMSASSSPKRNKEQIEIKSNSHSSKNKYSIQSSNLKYFFHKGNWSLVSLFLFIVLLIVTCEAFKDRWIFIWSCNCYAWGFYSYLAMYIIIIFANIIWYILRQYIQKFYEERFSEQIHSLAMERILNAPLFWHDTTPSGKIIRSITSSSNAILPLIVKLSSTVQNFGVLVIGAYYIVVEVPEFLIGLIALGILAVVLRRVSRALVTSCTKFEERSEEKLNTNFQEMLDGFYGLRANKNEYLNWVRLRIYSAIDDQAKAQMIRNFTILWVNIRWKAITTLVFFIVIITRFFKQKIMITSTVGFSLEYTLKICWILELLFINYKELAVHFDSYKRTLHFITEIPQEETIETSINGDLVAEGNITVKNMSLRYQKHLPYVIRDVSFTIYPGEKVRVVGRSGSGKSTLLLGLLKVVNPYPPHSIEIDNISTDSLSLKELRSKVAMIPQEPWVFSGTIRDNIDPSHKLTNDTLMDILRRVGLIELLKKKLEDIKSIAVLDIEIAENGSNLSQGEKQLICIARVLARQPKVLLLDEATSTLDEVTEDKALKSIWEMLENSTIIMISHKESTLEKFTRVFHVTNNSVEEKFA